MTQIMCKVQRVDYAKSLIGYINQEVTYNGNCIFDVCIVCRDGSFQWNKFLLSAMGNLLRSILQCCDDVSHVFLPDFSVEQVKTALYKIITADGITPIPADDQFLIFLYCQNRNDHDVDQGIHEHFQVKPKLPDMERGIDEHFKVQLERPLKRRHRSEKDKLSNVNIRSKKHQPTNFVKGSDIKDKINFGGKKRKINKLDQFDTEKGCFICTKGSDCAGLEFDEVLQLRKHIKDNHHGYFFADGLKVDGIWNCRHCPIKFPFRRNLQEHLENKHIEKLDNLEICDICGKKLRRKAMKSHILEHEGPVKCPNCFKMYSTKASLDIHIKFLHKDVRLVFCDTCGMSFKTKQLLKRHINGVHRKLRRYQCVECGDRFLSKANLMTHCKGRHGHEFQENLMKVLSENEASSTPLILSLRSKCRPQKKQKHQLQKTQNPVSFRGDLPKIKNLIASDHFVRKEDLGPLAVAAEVSITTSATKRT